MNISECDLYAVNPVNTATDMSILCVPTAKCTLKLHFKAISISKVISSIQPN